MGWNTAEVCFCFIRVRSETEIGIFFPTTKELTDILSLATFRFAENETCFSFYSPRILSLLAVSWDSFRRRNPSPFYSRISGAPFSFTPPSICALLTRNRANFDEERGDISHVRFPLLSNHLAIALHAFFSFMTLYTRVPKPYGCHSRPLEGLGMCSVPIADRKRLGSGRADVARVLREGQSPKYCSLGLRKFKGWVGYSRLKKLLLSVVFYPRRMGT